MSPYKRQIASKKFHTNYLWHSFSGTLCYIHLRIHLRRSSPLTLDIICLLSMSLAKRLLNISLVSDRQTIIMILLNTGIPAKKEIIVFMYISQFWILLKAYNKTTQKICRKILLLRRCLDIHINIYTSRYQSVIFYNDIVQVIDTFSCCQLILAHLIKPPYLNTCCP